MMEIKSINNLSSDKMSIEDEELKTGSWINDPIFENLNRKSLRLRGINDDLKLNSNNLAPNSKNSALNLKNLEIFLEENDKKNPINHIQKNNPTKLQSNYPIKKNTSPNVFVNSTNSLKVSNVLTTDIAERNNPNLNKNIMNQKIPDNSREELPLLRKKKKNEKE